jgi:group I intron endonuclease
MIVYKITNLINEKIYVGQTVSTLSVRLSQHFHYSLKKNSDGVLGKAIRKYGKENFIIEQIDIASCLEELNSKEVFWIKELGSHVTFGGYNLAFGGSSRAGWKEDPIKTKARIAKNFKPIMCIETGEAFPSIKEAAKKMGVTPGFLTNVLKGRKQTAKGCHFKFIGKME